jgi:uncharacterized protein (TIGR03435 family)
MKTLASVALTILSPYLALSQPAAKPLAFEVASIKPARPPVGGVIRVSTSDNPGGINYTNASLKILLMRAYDVQPHQISGPSWIESDRYLYDIIAKAPAGTPKEQFPAMLQTLLAERLKVVLHRETRQETAYALVVGKNTPKLKKSAEVPGGAPGRRGAIGFMATPTGIHQEARRVTMAGFAHMLSINLGRPVADRTGIEGNFDITLDFSGEGLTENLRRSIAMAARNHPAKTLAEGGPAPDSTPVPSLFTAVEQLGLKLEPRKAPVEYIVVDKAEKVPTEN